MVEKKTKKEMNVEFGEQLLEDNHDMHLTPIQLA